MMPRTSISTLAAAIILLAAAGLAPAAVAQGDQGQYEEMEGDTLLEADLTGEAETPVQGDLDGSGSARIAIRADFSELCWQIEVEGLDEATAAHVHEGGGDVSGPVVVTLSAAADATAEGCVSADATTLERIANESASFYVNVHNTEFPDGALRGQLEEQDDDDFFDDFGDDDEDEDEEDDDGTDDGSRATPQRGEDAADTPAPGLLVTLALIGAAAVVMRRRR